jgi:hypothetical protein
VDGDPLPDLLSGLQELRRGRIWRDPTAAVDGLGGPVMGSHGLFFFLIFYSMN